MERMHARRRAAGRRPWTALLTSLALAAAGSPAWSACRIQTFEIPVRMVGMRPVTTVGLNGTQVPMLVDSGAFFSMVMHSTASQLKLVVRSLPPGYRIEGYTGSIDARLTQVHEVDFNGAKLPDIQFLVGPNELGAGLMGVLGRNLLAMADTEYDLAHGVVRLVFPKGDCGSTNLAYWAKDAPVNEMPLVRDGPGDTAIRVRARINGESVRALLDTGATDTAIALRAARSAGIREADMTPADRVGGAGSGHARTWSAPVSTFELGGEKITNNRMGVADVDNLDVDLLLGVDYFLSHRILVSQLQNRLYATWNGGPVFANNRADDADDARYVASPAPAPAAADDASQLARHGEAAAARGDLQQALRDLDRACAMGSASAADFLARARVHERLEQPVPALADLDTALRLAPADAQARAARAALRARQGDRAGALADLAALDASLAPYSPLQADAAKVYARLDMAPEALHHWEAWLATHPRDAGRGAVFDARCWLRTRLKRELQEALEDCRRAVDEDDGNGAFRRSLGWTWLRLGEPARARTSFDDAVRLGATGDDKAWALYGRAQAARLLGDADASGRDAQAARQADPRIDAQVKAAGFEVEPAGVAATATAPAASASGS